MNKLTSRITSVIHENNFVQKTLQFNRKDKKAVIEANTVRELVNKLEKAALKKSPGMKIVVRALMNDKWSTLKSANGPLQIEDFEEYYDGLAKDTSKFTKISIIQITLIKNL